jgi:hypothetical protein
MASLTAAPSQDYTSGGLLHNRCDVKAFPSHLGSCATRIITNPEDVSRYRWKVIVLYVNSVTGFLCCLQFHRSRAPRTGKGNRQTEFWCLHDDACTVLYRLLAQTHHSGSCRSCRKLTFDGAVWTPRSVQYLARVDCVR